MSCPSVASTLTPILEETHHHLVSPLTDRTVASCTPYAVGFSMCSVEPGIPDDVGMIVRSRSVRSDAFSPIHLVLPPNRHRRIKVVNSSIPRRVSPPSPAQQRKHVT